MGVRFQRNTQSTDVADSEEMRDCDDYLERYEKWMADYIVLLEKYMKNPMDASLAGKFMELAQESSKWMNEWTTTLAFCASSEKYEKRFNEISEKAEKRMKELGIE